MRSLYYDIRRRISNFCYYIRKLLHLPDPVDFKYVDIVFENCNVVRIPARLVTGLYISDTRKDIYTNFCQQFGIVDYCMEFRITLKNEALTIETHFQKLLDKDGDSTSSFEHHLKVYKDITHIAIKPNKGKELYIGIPYKTKNRNSNINLLQNTKFEKDTFTISSKEGVQ